MSFLHLEPGATVKLAVSGTQPEAVHVFDAASIHAVNAALAARRPLLIRGEPGIGKSQLARAAASALGRAFLHRVVDSRTESRDLLWHFDAVARLAEAQLLGAAGGELAALRTRLAVSRYVHPGPLWWAFDWERARTQAEKVGRLPPAQPDEGDSRNGCLVLIDEIDKAETDVPNGLLEALGEQSFHPEGLEQPVRASGIAPLVVVTTNEERALPDAFVRRCLALQLAFPKLPDERDAFKQLFVERARAHFADRAEPDVLEQAADLLIEHRERAQAQQRLPLPGQAEYLDLLRAVLALDERAERQRELLGELSRFVLDKHPRDP